MVQRFGPQVRRRRPRSLDEPQQTDDPEVNEAQQRRRSLAEVGLSVRAVNTLENSGVLTVGELAAKTRDQLFAIDNFGDQTLSECRALLARLQVKTPNWNKPPRAKRSKRKGT